MSAVVGSIKRPYITEPKDEYEKDLFDGIDEPEAKRRAQNRAAQRAFRERKEKHLKGLEFRLKELETESRSWKSTNMALRSQLMALEEELQQYRGGDSKPSSNSPPTLDVKSEHDVPATQRQYIPSPQSLTGLGSGTTGSVPPKMPIQSQKDWQLPLNFAQSPVTPSSQFLLQQNQIQPSLLESQPEPELPFVEPKMVTGQSQSAEEFCGNLSLACGTRDKPIPVRAPTVAAEFPTWQSPSEESNTAINPFSGDTTLPGLMADDYSLFDPLEDLFDFPPPENKAEQIAPEFPQDVPQRPQEQAQEQAQEQVPKSGVSQDEEVPASNAKFMTCSDVWDRICAHPRFGEIDIDGICVELRTRAKCSDAGVVLTEKDLNDVLTSIQSS